MDISVSEGKREQQSEESCDPGAEPELMETQPAADAESKEVEMTNVTEEKAQETLSDQTQSVPSNPSATVKSAAVEETAGASVAGSTEQSQDPTTVSEPPAAVNPPAASTAATPPATKSPAPLDVPAPTPSPTHSTPIGKAAPAGRNAPSKGAAVAVNAAAKPAAACENPVAPTTGSVAKPSPAACSETSLSVAAGSAAKPSPPAANASSKPPLDAESPALQPATVSGEEPAQPEGQPAPGNTANPTDGAVASSPTATPPADPAAGDPAVEKPSLGPAVTPTEETHATDEATAPTASPTLAPPKTPTSPSTARPLKSMVVKPSGKESAAAKACEKKAVPPRKEHAARETGKAGTPATGRSMSRERFSREGSGRSSSSHQRERERDYRSDRRHMSQYQRDKEYRLYSRSKMYYERSSRGRRGSNRSPRREERGVFPFNLDEFVTVDEVGEEEDSAGDQIPEMESKTDIQASDDIEPETTEAEAAEEAQSPEPAAAGDGSKGVETTEVQPEAEPQAEVGAQPEPQPEAEEEPMETEAAQEKPAEAPTPEPSKAPVSDTKPEVAGTTAVKGEAAAAMAGSGEPSSSTAVPPPSNPVPAASRGDNARPTGSEQQADLKLKRESAPEVEPAVKRIKLAGTPLSELKMPPYKPNSPIGVEFIVPKTGYFCQICSLFYTNEDTAKVTHCGTMLHYKNMEKYVTQRQEEMRRQQERVVKTDK